MYGGNIGGTCGSGCMTLLADKTDICGSFSARFWHGSRSVRRPCDDWASRRCASNRQHERAQTAR
jgi:hypothetical protein